MSKMSDLHLEAQAIGYDAIFGLEVLVQQMRFHDACVLLIQKLQMSPQLAVYLLTNAKEHVVSKSLLDLPYIVA